MNLKRKNMTKKILFPLIVGIAMMFTGCGGGGGGGNTNHTPTASNQSIVIESEESKSITLNGNDIDGDTLRYRVSTNPTHGTLSGTAPNLTYTADVGYHGTDSFQFVINDGQVDSTAATVSISITAPAQKVTISGTITYDLVPVQSDGSGLDYSNTHAAPAKWITIQAVDNSNHLIDSTTTDADGKYTLTQIPESTNVKIYILAEMKKSGTPGWNVKVVDNTNSSALYVVSGSLLSSGTTDSTRNYRLSSGWTGTSYSSSRLAAPFAILNDIYAAMQTLLDVESDTVFPDLVVNWSTENTPSSGDKAEGKIGTSHYTDGNLYILGDADNDTDEYDDHVITHEWGHYYEDKFSRSDSIGGSHGGGDRLDIRVAFGEGWGNAFSAISLNDPVYFDTYDDKQEDGWFMDMESGTANPHGWYSEASIQNIIYDLWDNHNDNSDTLSLGFGPIHHAFIGAQKTTPAFTSIFSFITILKNENSGNSDAIDDIVSDESIAVITDIYGSENTGLAKYPYHDLTIGAPVEITTSTSYGTFNKLSNRQYVKFSIATSKPYIITVEKSSSSNDTDPDFVLYKTDTFSYVDRGNGTAVNKEEKSISLDAGNYLLDISEYNNVNTATFDVTVQ
jgi:hypothetical protein